MKQSTTAIAISLLVVVIAALTAVIVLLSVQPPSKQNDLGITTWDEMTTSQQEQAIKDGTALSQSDLDRAVEDGGIKWQK